MSTTEINEAPLQNGARQLLSCDAETLLDAYTQMLRARKIDEKSIVLYKQNKSHFHIGCAGHEAIQVATAHVMNPSLDWTYPYYRDLAFCGAWGVTPRELFLGILNKAEDPASGGRQMPMHFGHKDLRIVSQSSPTGTQYLQATGCAGACVRTNRPEIVYVSSGEGTTAQGAYHEALNWAARKKLPLVVVIQDNDFAISVHVSDQIAGGSVANISSGYEGLAVEEVDGLDYLKAREVMSRVVERARNGEGPSVVVAKVVRLESHSISDNQAKYRSPDELAEDKSKDPIIRLQQLLIEHGISTAEKLAALENEIQQEVDEAAMWAEEQADPTPDSAETHLFIKRDPGEGVIENKAQGDEVFMVDALNHGLDEEMQRDERVVIYGQDVAYGKGGVFSVTSGLTEKYSDHRIFNAPLAEASIIGTAIGMCVGGLKPVVEVQFGDYVWTSMMQIRNELAMFNYRSAGNWRCPVVVRIAIGGYIHGGLYHSQNIEATFSHFPGLHIVLPSNATDAKGLLKSAIRGEDPVLFLEHKGLYRQVYAKGKEGGADDLIPIGRARIVKEGSDATIVTWGALVHKATLAAETLEKEGASVEIIDLRSIYPLDRTSIINSIKKTNRLLIAHEDVLFMGFGAEIAAMVSEHAFEYLDAPITRVGGKFTPIPHAEILENAVLPQTSDVEAGLRKLLSY